MKITTLLPADIAEAVERGAVLNATINAAKDELKEINEFLACQAENGEQVPLEDAEREGRQFLAESERSIVPVVITADLITKTFQEGSPLHQDLSRLVGPSDLGRIYQRKIVFESKADDGVKFRRVVKATLPDNEAAAFLTACIRRDKMGIPVSQTRVEWDRLRSK